MASYPQTCETVYPRIPVRSRAFEISAQLDMSTSNSDSSRGNLFAAIGKRRGGIWRSHDGSSLLSLEAKRATALGIGRCGGGSCFLTSLHWERLCEAPCPTAVSPRFSGSRQSLLCCRQVQARSTMLLEKFINL